MTWVLYVDMSVGLALASAVLVMCLLSGCQQPVRSVLWSIGLGLLVLRAALSAAIAVGVLSSSEASWAFVTGALALFVTLPMAVLQSRPGGLDASAATFHGR